MNMLESEDLFAVVEWKVLYDLEDDLWWYVG
jgi:hypothetical protein